jgi:hypothetical protein
MLRTIALIATTSLAATLFAAQNPNRLEVPRTRRPPVIDGNANRTEWKGAARVSLGDGAFAMLLNDGTFLYVALIGEKPGTGSVCASTKTGVRVLHASAALGTATFEPQKGKWTLTRPFTWTNRDTSASPAGQAERNKMLATEGWFANTNRTAVLEREYQIAVRGLREVPLTLGFFTYTPKEQRLSYWPTTLEDDCANGDLAGGYTDGELTFDPAKWGVAVLK